MATGALTLKYLFWELSPPRISQPTSPTAPKKPHQKERLVSSSSTPRLKHPEDGNFGDLSLIQSQWRTDRKWVEIMDIHTAMAGTKIWVRGRMHKRPVSKGSAIVFLILRAGFYSIQLVVHDQITSREMVKYAAKITPESVVDVYGEVQKAKIDKTSQHDVELHVTRIYCVNAAESVLPFQLVDASQPIEDKRTSSTSAEEDSSGKNKQILQVNQDTRLNFRWIDLRTPANHAIFKLQAAVSKYFREYFDSQGFVEVHTPKITPGVSEGGAQVFQTKYFGRPACLAQSPQLYKQMAVMSDLVRVYEIGPVFRAEPSFTHRHVCEFTGLDFEMGFKEHYHEVISVLGNLLVYIFDQLAKNHQTELNAVNNQYKFIPLQYQRETLVLDFREAMQLLKEHGEVVDNLDFPISNEKALGKIVKQKYQTDLFIVDKYPQTARPFYTMPDPTTPGYTNSYDVFLRGEEIASGAQRIHDPKLLTERASECKIPINSIASYISSFKYGAFPHGGAGLGLERLLMLYLGLDNIRKSSLFPRDPTRLEP